MNVRKLAHEYRRYLLPVLVCTGLFGCATNQVRDQPLDLSTWRSAEQDDGAGVAGLWYGTQKCSHYLGSPLDVLVGFRPLGGGRYEVLAAAAHQEATGTLTSFSETLTLNTSGNGQVFKGRKAERFALRYLRMGGVDRDDRLTALVLDYDASDNRRIDECPAASLSRLDDPSQSPLLSNWSLERPSVFAQRRQLFGLRHDLAGQWQGLANCKGGTVPIDLTLSQNPVTGWLADLIIDGQIEQYRMMPSPSPGRLGAYRFKPIGKRAASNLGALQSGIVDKHGRAAWLKLNMTGGCKDNLLYRHWQIAGLSGEYASTTNLNSFCETVRSYWIGDVSEVQSRADAIAELISDTPWHYPATQAVRWTVNDGERFLKTFGIPLEEIPGGAYDELTSQLASCGALGSKHLREDFRLGLFNPGTLRRFDPGRREYPLYTSQDVLARFHRDEPSGDELLQQAHAETKLSDLDRLMESASKDMTGSDPATLYPSLQKLVQHRRGLQAEAAALERERIRREGPPRIDAEILNASVHQLLKRRLSATDLVLSAAMRLPSGFAYSCGAENYCKAMGGLVTYRYYVASLIGCDYAGKTQAHCEYRLGLDVQSTLSPGNDFRNKLLAGQGALMTAAVMESQLSYRDWKWVIEGGIFEKE